MEAFYALATEDYRQLVAARPWAADLSGHAVDGRVRLLDVACGSGKFPTALLAGGLPDRPVVEVDLLDPSAFSIAEARAVLAPPFVAAGEHEVFLQDFSGTGYDVAWATHALYALPPAELAAGVARMVAALRPGGFGAVAQASSRSHYLTFYDAYRASFAPEATPYTDAEGVTEALRSGCAGRGSGAALPHGDIRSGSRRGFPATVRVRRLGVLGRDGGQRGARRLSRRVPGRQRRVRVRARSSPDHLAASVIRNPHLSETTAAGTASDVAVEWDRGNDQWWDWYMSLADGPVPDGPFVDPPPHDPGPLPSDDEVAAELTEPYPVTADQIQQFQSDAFIKLPGVLTPGAVERLRARLREMLDETVDPTVGFQSREMMWLEDDLVRAAVLSPRIGGISAALLGTHQVRLYHDNALSKQPGAGRTPWHYDAHHFPLDSPDVLTAWIPLQPTPATWVHWRSPVVSTSGSWSSTSRSTNTARRTTEECRKPFVHTMFTWRMGRSQRAR